MTKGMLWFDNSTLTLAEKIRKAAEYFHKKYGRVPDLCLVHPSMLEGETHEIEGITARPYRPVLPGHIWIGFEEMPTEENKAAA